MTQSPPRIVLCMKWGTKYGPEYVNRLYGMTRRHLSGAFRFVCLTDSTDGVRPEVECFPLPELALAATRRDARARASEMLAHVGLAQRLNHYPKVLSGGEQQRVALARAFVVRPAVLLADEPTGSLDFATGATVMELMFELNREAGTTLVLVTHDSAIAARCQRQLRIEAGRLVS